MWNQVFFHTITNPLLQEKPTLKLFSKMALTFAYQCYRNSFILVAWVSREKIKSHPLPLTSLTASCHTPLRRKNWRSWRAGTLIWHSLLATLSTSNKRLRTNSLLTRRVSRQHKIHAKTSNVVHYISFSFRNAFYSDWGFLIRSVFQFQNLLCLRVPVHKLWDILETGPTSHI